MTGRCRRSVIYMHGIRRKNMKHITAAYFFFSAVTAEAASFTENTERAESKHRTEGL